MSVVNQKYACPASFKRTFYIYDTITNIERFLKCKDGCLILPSSIYAMFNENSFEHLCAAMPISTNVYNVLDTGYVDRDTSLNTSEPKYAITCEVLIPYSKLPNKLVEEVLKMTLYQDPYKSVATICKLYNISLPD